MSKNQNLTPRDRVQIQGFQTLFRARCTPDDEGRRMTTEQAFISAICDTCDETVDRLYEEDEKREMIETWLKEYGQHRWRFGKRKIEV